MGCLHKKQSIPVSLALYVVQAKLVNTFRLYLNLKFRSSGLISNNSNVINDLKNVKGYTCEKTLQKHLAKLISMNWIGFNSTSGNYFLRNLQFICAQLNLDTKKFVKVETKDLKELGVFLAAVTMNDLVKSQSLYFEKIYPRKNFAAVKNTGSAIQAKPSLDYFNLMRSGNTKPDYYGFSNNKLGEVLGISKSYASKLQTKANSSKYIHKKQRTMVLFHLPSPNYKIRNQLYRSYPELEGKLFFRVSKDGAAHDFLMESGEVKQLKLNAHIELVCQLHNEIKPRMKFKSCRVGKTKANKKTIYSSRKH